MDYQMDTALDIYFGFHSDGKEGGSDGKEGGKDSHKDGRDVGFSMNINSYSEELDYRF